MKNPGSSAGIILIVIGITLLIGGITAYLWEVEEIETSFWSTTTEITHPYRELGTWFIGMGFIALMVGIVLFAIQNYLIRPEAFESIKIRCKHCQSLNDETETNCGNCGESI